MSPALFYLFLALGLIGAELLILQFTVFWFFFFGVAALLTSIMCWILPELSWVAATATFLLASIVVSAGLYPMLKKWQNKPAPIAGNDAIGQSAKVVEEIQADRQGKVLWSGTEWPAQLADGQDSLQVGDKVVIRKLEGIRLIVGR